MTGGLLVFLGPSEMFFCEYLLLLVVKMSMWLSIPLLVVRGEGFPASGVL